MLFNSIPFIFAFLPIVLIGYALAGLFTDQVARHLWLAVASLFFYAYWNPPYLALFLVSVLVNYAFSNAIAEYRSKRLLVAGVAFNVGLIAYFKYLGFFASSLNALLGTGLPEPSFLMPLAISFFTFQQIAYLVDVYQGKIADRNFLRYVLFVSFFPHLIAGPVLHHAEIMPQFAERRPRLFKVSDVCAGASLFLIGLQKKLILADGIAIYSDTFFKSVGPEPTLLPSWIGVLAFTFQIYFDFSGYTDMALGLARLFGIRLPENFNSPYKAVSIIDFWRRWHMTLSRFLRDYVYIPLGGNRQGPARRYVNLMMTMLLGGLWHGAAWTFILWGGLHGLFLVINHLWRAARRTMGYPLDRSTALGRFASGLLTFLAVVVSWVFFRAQSWPDAIAILNGMVGLNGVVLPASWTQILGGSHAIQFSDALSYCDDALLRLLALGAIAFVLPNSRQIVENGARLLPVFNVELRFAAVAPILVSGIVTLLLVVAKGSATNDFIYMVF